MCYTMKVPMDIIENPFNRSYKYFVKSPATKEGAINSFEFISGPRTRRGNVINRCFKLHAPMNMINRGG